MTQDELPPPAPESAAAPATAGARLAAARELAGMSIDDVSRQLKLAPRQVVAIERDDHASLPGRTFVRGFVRNYARLLKLDAGDVVAALPADAGPSSTDGAGLAPTPRPMGELPNDTRMRRPASRWAIPAVLIAIVAVAAFYEFARGPSPTTGRPVPADRATPAGLSDARAPGGSASDAPASGSPPAVPAAGADTASPPVAATPAPPSGSTGGPATTPTTPPAGSNPVSHSIPLPNPLAGSSPSVPVPATAAPTGPAAAPSPAAVPMPSIAATPAPRGSASLSLAFRGTSWIEVRDRNGQVVLAMTGNDGATREVSIAPGGELTVGNVAGLDVSWRGRPLDLSPHSRQNVARVRLD